MGRADHSPTGCRAVRTPIGQIQPAGMRPKRRPWGSRTSTPRPGSIPNMPPGSPLGGCLPAVPVPRKACESRQVYARFCIL
jgi:hypothetical protein